MTDNLGNAIGWLHDISDQLDRIIFDAHDVTKEATVRRLEDLKADVQNALDDAENALYDIETGEWE